MILPETDMSFVRRRIRNIALDHLAGKSEQRVFWSIYSQDEGDGDDPRKGDDFSLATLFHPRSDLLRRVLHDWESTKSYLEVPDWVSREKILEVEFGKRPDTAIKSVNLLISFDILEKEDVPEDDRADSFNCKLTYDGMRKWLALGDSDVMLVLDRILELMDEEKLDRYEISSKNITNITRVMKFEEQSFRNIRELLGWNSEDFERIRAKAGHRVRSDVTEIQLALDGDWSLKNIQSVMGVLKKKSYDREYVNHLKSQLREYPFTVQDENGKWVFDRAMYGNFVEETLSKLVKEEKLV
jgi:hypothetical protein